MRAVCCHVKRESKWGLGPVQPQNLSNDGLLQARTML
jgi:hypothetical protein